MTYWEAWAVTAMALLVLLATEPEFNYTAEDLALISKDSSHQFNKNKRLWYTCRKKKKILPQRQAEAMIKQLHPWTRLGVSKLIQTFSKTKNHVPGLKHLPEQVVHKCVPCQRANVCHTIVDPGERHWEDRPGVYWEVDFTEKTMCMNISWFLWTFSRWIEAFPCKKRDCSDSHQEDY